MGELYQPQPSEQPTAEEIPQLRNFTKEQAPDERRELAHEVRELRGQYFSHGDELSQRIGDLGIELETHKQSASQLIIEISEIESELETKKDSLISRLLDFLTINELQRKLGIKKQNLEQIQKRQLELQAIITDLDQEKNDRGQLDLAKNRIAEFYQGKSADWQDYEAEQQACNVRNVAREHDALFIHALHTGYVPGSNSALNTNTTWEQKLKVDVALKPSLSCSSIINGDDSGNMWGPVGIILNQGTIKDASWQDNATKAGVDSKRSIRRSGSDELVGTINKTFENRRPHGYNEFNIANPGISGLYLARDEKTRMNPPENFTEADFFRVSQEMQLPVYLLENGKLYLGEFNLEKKCFVPKEETKSMSQPTEAPVDISEEKRQQLIQEIIADCPFRIPEIPHLITRVNGRKDYLQLMYGGKDWSDLSDEERNSIEPGSKAHIIDSFPSVGTPVNVIEDNGALFIQEKNLSSKWLSEHSTETRRVWGFGDSHHNRQTIQAGSYSFMVDRPIMNTEDYLGDVTALLKRYELDHSAVDNQYKMSAGEFIMSEKNYVAVSLACLVYGFGEQAEAMGDEETKAKAFALAEKVLPLDRYQAIISKLDEQGRLKITPEELEARFKNT